MEDVNIFVGRFQPFHKGHLQCCKDIYEKNGLPVVIIYMTNNSFNKRKPFDDELIEKELSMLKSKYKYIKDFLQFERPYPSAICDVLVKKFNYKPIIWIAGEDRIESYQRMTDKVIDKIKTELNINPPKFELTNRYCSATEVRQTIFNDDFEAYSKLMPDKINKDINLYNEFKNQINKINESKMINLTDYIQNNIR